MILRIISDFRDFQYTEEDPRGVRRLAGTFVDVPEERAEELIKAKVAVEVEIVTLDKYVKGQKPQEDTEPKDATVKEPKDMTVKELTEMLNDLGIDVPKKAKKAALLDLLK